jgi:putative peptidoglycan lipid II flippase
MRSERAVAPLTLMLAVVITIAAKFTAFIRDVVLSYYFGVGPATDAYFIASLLPGLAWLSVFATISTVFLPYYTDLRQRSVSAGVRLAQEGTQIYLVASAALAILCIAFANPIVRMTAPSAAPATLALASELTMIMAVGFLFTGYVGLQNAIQQAHGQFLPPLVAPLANNLVSISAICVAGWAHSIRLAAIGSVLGWAIQAPLQRFGTFRYHPTRWAWHARMTTVRRLSALAAPAMLGTLLDQVNIYVGIAVAGRLGPGAISHLNYAARLATFLATGFSWLVSYFLFPRLARFAARRNDQEVGRTLTAGIFIILAFTAPLLVVVITSKQAFVGLVFGRGAFTPRDVIATSLVFGFYAWGLVFIAVREILNRVFFSFQRTAIPLIFGVIGLAANAGLALLLSRQMGIAGIAIAAATSSLVYAVLQFIALGLWKPVLLQGDLLRLSGLVTLATLACVLAISILDRTVESSGIIRLVLVSVVGAVVYLGVLVPALVRTGFGWSRFSDLLVS